jgi:hypothetical protein
MHRVLNAKQVGKTSSAIRVYVGRPSKWGNPFVLGRDGSRDEVIRKYRAWTVTQPALMSALHELRGKDLICARRNRATRMFLRSWLIRSARTDLGHPIKRP